MVIVAFFQETLQLFDRLRRSTAAGNDLLKQERSSFDIRIFTVVGTFFSAVHNSGKSAGVDRHTVAFVSAHTEPDASGVIRTLADDHVAALGVTALVKDGGIFTRHVREKHPAGTLVGRSILSTERRRRHRSGKQQDRKFFNKTIHKKSPFQVIKTVLENLCNIAYNDRICKRSGKALPSLF